MSQKDQDDFYNKGVKEKKAVPCAARGCETVWVSLTTTDCFIRLTFVTVSFKVRMYRTYNIHKGLEVRHLSSMIKLLVIYIMIKFCIDSVGCQVLDDTLLQQTNVLVHYGDPRLLVTINPRLQQTHFAVGSHWFHAMTITVVSDVCFGGTRGSGAPQRMLWDLSFTFRNALKRQIDVKIIPDRYNFCRNPENTAKLVYILFNYIIKWEGGG